jgi:DNA-binding response OmpR family regulator
MARPTFLIAEQEPAYAISTRKLLLESARFNVITAHSTGEAIDLFHLFPNISAVIVVDSEIDCESLANAIKKANNRIPVIFLSAHIGATSFHSDHQLSSHEPEALLRLVHSLFGDPRRPSK